MELGTAVAAAGGKNIACETFTMDSHEWRFHGSEIPFDQSEVVGVIEGASIEVQLKVPKIRGELDHLFSFDELFT
jgi:hypothetical protein